MREQRRLFYVAITRCTQTLVISSFTGITRQLAWKIGAQVVWGPGPNGPTVASQFSDELGPAAPAAKRGSLWARLATQNRLFYTTLGIFDFFWRHTVCQRQDLTFKIPLVFLPATFQPGPWKQAATGMGPVHIPPGVAPPSASKFFLMGWMQSGCNERNEGKPGASQKQFASLSRCLVGAQGRNRTTDTVIFSHRFEWL